MDKDKISVVLAEPRNKRITGHETILDHGCYQGKVRGFDCAVFAVVLHRGFKWLLFFSDLRLLEMTSPHTAEYNTVDVVPVTLHIEANFAS